jgi:hypothetical protein
MIHRDEHCALIVISVFVELPKPVYMRGVCRVYVTVQCYYSIGFVILAVLADSLAYIGIVAPSVSAFKSEIDEYEV